MLAPLSIQPPGLTTTDPHPLMTAAWNEGRIVIIATLGDGPDAGKQTLCITPRSELLGGIERARRGKLWRDQHFMDSLRGALSARIGCGIMGLNSSNDADFMGDLAVMMAIKIAGGWEQALDGSGLFSLLIIVSPDESLSWERRGFLGVPDIRAPVARMG